MKTEFTRIQLNNPRFSLRAFAKRIGIAPSAASEILAGQRPITARMAEKIIAGIEIDAGEAKELISQLTNRFAVERKQVPTGKFVQLQMDKFHLISEWYYFAILSLAETLNFDSSAEAIASRLNIGVPEAQRAISRLERLGLLKKTKAGLKATGQQFETSHDVSNLSIKKAHLQNLELARQSLMSDGVEDRDHTSMTMAVDPKRVAEAKKMIREFRRKLCDFLEAGQKREVYRFSAQLFALSKKR